VKKRLITLTVMIALILSMSGSAAFAVELPSGVNSLEAPKNVTVELKQYVDGRPYFLVIWSNPKSISDLVSYWDENGESPLGYQIDAKVGNEKWNYEIYGDAIMGNSLHAGYNETDEFVIKEAAYDPINEGLADTVDIKSNVYSFRVRYSYFYSDDNGDNYLYSPFSNTASIGTGSFYQGASNWAVAELDKAAQYGLITDRIKNNMRGPITREEFAELATRLYEVYTGNKAEAAPASTFTDTDNIEILKAYKLGIVAGVGNNKFEPKSLTNREQIAAMLNRAVKVIAPDTDFSIAGAPTFVDEKDIAPYFVENVKFMAKNGFISGVGGSRFAPKDQCTREQAVLIAVRVYEAYK